MLCDTKHLEGKEERLGVMRNQQLGELNPIIDSGEVTVNSRPRVSKNRNASHPFCKIQLFGLSNIRGGDFLQKPMLMNHISPVGAINIVNIERYPKGVVCD